MLARFLLFNILITSSFASAKIASFDLCADQWLMAFAQPDQVAFLTPLSKDPNLSYHHEKAKNYAIDTPSVETLLTGNIDMVLATSPLNPSIKKILEKKGIRVIIIPTLTNLDQLIEWTQKIKNITGSNSEIILKLQDLRHINAEAKKALYIGTAGSSPGQKTLVNEAFYWAGFENIKGYEGWGYKDIETILVQNPHYIFTAGTLPKNRVSINNHLYGKQTQAVVIPVSQRYTICACPDAFIDLIKVFKNAKK